MVLAVIMIRTGPGQHRPGLFLPFNHDLWRRERSAWPYLARYAGHQAPETVDSLLRRRLDPFSGPAAG